MTRASIKMTMNIGVISEEKPSSESIFCENIESSRNRTRKTARNVIMLKRVAAIMNRMVFAFFVMPASLSFCLE
jgi:hypothetical protein